MNPPRLGFAARAALAMVLSAAAAMSPAQPHIEPRDVAPNALAVDPGAPELDQRLDRLRADAASPNRERAGHAAWLLGLLALHGVGQAADGARAQDWFQRAWRMGYPLAPAGLAWCAIDGCGGLPQLREAQSWIDTFRRVSPARAATLQWLLAQRRAGVDPAGTQAANSARASLLAAAKADDAYAQNELALEHAAAGRWGEAAELLRMAAPRSPAAAANLQVLQSRRAGAGPPRESASQEEAWYQRARRYHRGDGVPANYTEAIRLYELAAARGHAKARRMLELIFSRPAPDGTPDVLWIRQLADAEFSPEGTVSLDPPRPLLATLQRDSTPLLELVPKEWRSQPLR